VKGSSDSGRYLSQRTVTPSLVLDRSGSARSSGTAWIEDGERLARYEIPDDAFLLAEREGFSQAMMQRAAFAGGTVTVDDFQGTHALAFGFPDFVQNHPAGLVEGGETAFDIESFKVHRIRLLPLTGQGKSSPEIWI
jgi:hypothetical protein